jgi:hypothetical protein
MARRPIDEGLFVDQTWHNKRNPTEKIVIVMIYRKDRIVRYYRWGPNIVKRLAATHPMPITDLRRYWEPEELYIK